MDISNNWPTAWWKTAWCRINDTNGLGWWKWSTVKKWPQSHVQPNTFMCDKPHFAACDPSEYQIDSLKKCHAFVGSVSATRQLLILTDVMLVTIRILKTFVMLPGKLSSFVRPWVTLLRCAADNKKAKDWLGNSQDDAPLAFWPSVCIDSSNNGW